MALFEDQIPKCETQLQTSARQKKALRILNHLEDFAKRYGKTDDGEGLLEFYARLHYRTGFDDGRAQSEPDLR